jgi:hypothetical protein
LLGAALVIVYHPLGDTDMTWATVPWPAITIPSFLINSTNGHELVTWYNDTGTSNTTPSFIIPYLPSQQQLLTRPIAVAIGGAAAVSVKVVLDTVDVNTTADVITDFSSR